MKLYLSAAAGGMGVLVTLLWVPELSTLDLAEGDLRWAALCRGALGHSLEQIMTYGVLARPNKARGTWLW